MEEKTLFLNVLNEISSENMIDTEDPRWNHLLHVPFYTFYDINLHEQYLQRLGLNHLY